MRIVVMAVEMRITAPRYYQTRRVEKLRCTNDDSLFLPPLTYSLHFFFTTRLLIIFYYCNEIIFQFRPFFKK